MRVRSGAAAAVLAVARASAQSAPTYGDGSVSYTTTTITRDVCPTETMETMITITNGVTVTYCPDCEHEGGGPPPTSSPTNSGPGYTTTYTTTYVSLCPTGPTTATYTVTESCTDDKPTWTPGPDHIPNGFTVTEKECHVCGKETPTITITEPCGCDATGGVPVPPKETPVQQISVSAATDAEQRTALTLIQDGQVQAPTPGNSGSPTNTPVPTRPVCNGEDCGGSGNQSPSTPTGGSAAPPACQGDDCGGSGTTSPPTECNGNDCGGSGAQNSSSPATSPQCPGPECQANPTQTPEPYEGAASSTHLGVVASVVLSAVIGAVAFML